MKLNGGQMETFSGFQYEFFVLNSSTFTLQVYIPTFS